jgi:hypothetical protein
MATQPTAERLPVKLEHLPKFVDCAGNPDVV